MEKKFDFKKFLSNNAIIILIILLALFVGCTTQNFFTETNGKNLLLNVAPRFIIACGVSGCLPSGRPGRLLLRHAAAER